MTIQFISLRVAALAFLVMGLVSCAHEEGDKGTVDVANTSAPGNNDMPFSVFSDHDWQYRFKGKMDDTYPIVMDLKCNTGQVKGKYWYEGKIGNKYDIAGSATKEGEIILIEKNAAGEPTAEFHGFFTSRLTVEGEWTSPTASAPMYFELRSTKANSDDATLWPHIADSVHQGVEVYTHKVNCWNCDCMFPIVYPQLQGAAGSAQQVAVNRELRKRFLSRQQWTCEDSYEGQKGITHEVLRLDEYVFSVKVFLNDKLFNAHNFDLKSGEYLEIMNVVRDRNALMGYVAQMTNSQVTEIEQLTFWMEGSGKVGILQLKEGKSVTMSLDSAPFGDWFRKDLLQPGNPA